MIGSGRTTEWLQWVLVISVLASSVYMAVINNKPDIIFNLTTLCFGYYFGSNQSNPPSARA